MRRQLAPMIALAVAAVMAIGAIFLLASPASSPGAKVAARTSARIGFVRRQACVIAAIPEVPGTRRAAAPARRATGSTRADRRRC